MKHVLYTILVLALVGCASAPELSSETAVYEASIPQQASFSDDSKATDAVKECGIARELSVLLQEQAQRYKIKLNPVPDSTDKNTGNYVALDIVNTISRNRKPFTGRRHAKSVTVETSIYENGKMVRSFRRHRRSSGGVGGWLKSSCTVLERTVETLAKDIARGLQNHVIASRSKEMK